MLTIQRPPRGNAWLQQSKSYSDFSFYIWYSFRNFSDLKTNNKYSSKKQDNVDLPFHKFYLLKRKSSQKKLRKWLINIVGLCSLTLQLVQKIKIHILSCSLNLKSLLTKNKIDTSTKQWWSSAPKFYKQLLIKVIFPNLKKK